VRVFALNDPQPLQVLQGHTDWVEDVDWSPDGRWIGSCSFEPDCSVRLWNPTTSTCAHVMRGHEGRIMSVQFHPDCNLIVSAGSDGTVRQWDVEGGQCVRSFGRLAQGWHAYDPHT
jgi:WD40 repeat protein